jgi:hypothetical protein
MRVEESPMTGCILKSYGAGDQFGHDKLMSLGFRHDLTRSAWR